MFAWILAVSTKHLKFLNNFKFKWISKDYLSHNTVTTDWVKRNWVIMSPAIKNYRKYLVDELHHARIIEDEEALAMLYAEYDILAPYIQLFKNFPKFLK